MRFKAELPRESHSIFYGVVQRLEKMESAGVPRSKRRAVLMLSPQGVNMVRARGPLPLPNARA